MATPTSGPARDKTYYLETITLIGNSLPHNENLISSVPKDHWISVLKPATLWRFLDIRNLALRHLDTQVKKGAEGIVLARRLRGVCPNYLSISPIDADMIKWETATKIYWIYVESVFGKAFRRVEGDSAEYVSVGKQGRVISCAVRIPVTKIPRCRELAAGWDCNWLRKPSRYCLRLFGLSGSEIIRTVGIKHVVRVPRSFLTLMANSVSRVLRAL
ncbi:hypothetical protein DFH08DRAFT_816843 [Mycena albidolilacea]|uniref:Uncharacterized protein n=1 Tax=Mycena albidolilacea TaxID=1033008 RepID=A0AAD6ZJ13_9AGAR|nr:hypothetical protein DFH08DRAFT_816843 [Mycena albidolilacea]